jgi:hypothetical protein
MSESRGANMAYVERRSNWVHASQDLLVCVPYLLIIPGLALGIGLMVEERGIPDYGVFFVRIEIL